MTVWLLLLVTATAMAAGPDSNCAPCHRSQFDRYYGANGARGSTMASALFTPAKAAILRANPRLGFVLGKYKYELVRQGEASTYSVTDGSSSLRVPVSYAFGHGAAGQTYVYQHEGKWYESRLSFYDTVKGLDLTMGAPPGEPRSLEEAAGRLMTDRDVLECFGCHTTNSVVRPPGKAPQIDFAAIQSGVRCDNCHPGSAPHAAGFAAGKPVAVAKLAKLTTEEQSDMCGRCHRTWADIAASGTRGVGNVRFQPYRLTNSKCYDATDRRISCTACHDPHGPLEHDFATYTSRCTACHAQGAKAAVCQKSSKDCVSCHMPRYEIPGSHHLFTDHQIRIVRPNEKYPD